MNVSDAEMLKKIRQTFSSRKMPKSQLVSKNFDLGHHQEARRVEEYLRKNESIIDRSNSALVAFNYVTAQTALWILPSYMQSIIENFRNDDLMIDLLFGALASGMPNADFSAQKDLGLRMKAIATDDEAKMICEFCHWLELKINEESLLSTSRAAIHLWCKLSGDHSPF